MDLLWIWGHPGTYGTFQATQGYTVGVTVWLWMRHPLCALAFYWLNEAIYIIELIYKGVLKQCMTLTFIIGAQEMLANNHATNSILSVPMLGCTSEDCTWLSLGKIGGEWMRICVSLSEELLPKHHLLICLARYCCESLKESRERQRALSASGKSCMYSIWMIDF